MTVIYCRAVKASIICHGSSVRNSNRVEQFVKGVKKVIVHVVTAKHGRGTPSELQSMSFDIRNRDWMMKGRGSRQGGLECDKTKRTLGKQRRLY
jgi:hypothetical protein